MTAKNCALKTYCLPSAASKKGKTTILKNVNNQNLSLSLALPLSLPFSLSLSPVLCNTLFLLNA